jgi:hypothetical protein
MIASCGFHPMIEWKMGKKNGKPLPFIKIGKVYHAGGAAGVD